MNNLLEKLAVEFSISQKAFHKHPVSDMIKTNLESVLMKKQNDYIPIGFFDTHEQADTFINKHYDKIKNYSIYESINGEMLVV